MNKSIKVGVYNWVKFPQSNDYYPSDLPADWRLSFYANEFETACICLGEDVDNLLLAESIEDLPDYFQLSFLLNSAEQIIWLRELIHQTGLKIDCLLYESKQRDILLQNNFTKPVSLHSLARAGICNSEHIIALESIWTADNKRGSSAIALLADSDDTRLFRQWIELWLEENSQQELTLWLDGARTRYSTLSKLRTLVELMGY